MAKQEDPKIEHLIGTVIALELAFLGLMISTCKAVGSNKPIQEVSDLLKHYAESIDPNDPPMSHSLNPLRRISSSILSFLDQIPDSRDSLFTKDEVERLRSLIQSLHSGEAFLYPSP